jgi:hypothetical protein
MIFPVEVVLKGRDVAVTQSLVVRHGDPATWDDVAVREVLVEILRAIDRAQNPTMVSDRAVVLQGFSWIVEPTAQGEVVIAIEIPMGAAVAGPFTVGQAELDERINRVIRAERELLSPQGTIH